MEATKKTIGKAIVYSTGGDKAITHAIATGVMDTRMARHAKEVQIENNALRHSEEFWKTMAVMRKKQVFDNSMQRIKDAEARRSWLYINNKTCLFFGFVAGVLFEVLLTTLVML